MIRRSEIMLAASGATGPAPVVAGVALDAAQKGQAWQLALLMLAKQGEAGPFSATDSLKGAVF